MDRGNGLISALDLQQYRAIWRQPLVAKWRNFEVHAAPPPSSGGVALLQLLKMKDLLSREFAGVSHNSSSYVHLIAEIEKRVFADRAKYMGDPQFVDVPHEELIDDAYLARRTAEINPTAISPTESVEPGLESMHTTHFSIIDRWGNAIANTYTINVGFGSGVVVKDAGFLLNNEMDDFSAKPGTPNAFGVVGAIANEIQPGKRMLSSMTPTILLSGDQVRMVVGSPGGSTIITSVMQTILNLLDFGHTPQEAVDAPRFHHQLLPKDQIKMSLALPSATQQALRSMGYTTTESTYGDVQLIWQDGRHLDAASDTRGRGSSLVIDHR
jgi:gamma-glutamyltranspeptidase/glutathione hydrolase